MWDTEEVAAAFLGTHELKRGHHSLTPRHLGCRVTRALPQLGQRQAAAPASGAHDSTRAANPLAIPVHCPPWPVRE